MASRKRKPASPTSHSRPASDDNVRETLVMFVDIVGASEVSNHKQPREYAEFVKRFQVLFKHTCKRFIDAWYDYSDYKIDARGDEGLLMLFGKHKNEDLAEEVDIAVEIALELKQRWLTSKDNSNRIQDGLLPIDLGIGIHTGPTVIQYESKEKHPEGYTINLCKRVESYSREGCFSQIMLSEAAHGHWCSLPDEETYLFDTAQRMNPKGISRSIRVFELKHHFLPSDWTDLLDKSDRSRSLLDPKRVKLDIMLEAIKLNPTNIWLIEEVIRSSMLVKYQDLTKNQRSNGAKLKEAFELARYFSELLRQYTQRDAGVQLIQGLVANGSGDYDVERDYYLEAIDDQEELGKVYWYLAQAFSYDLYDELDKNEDTEIQHVNLSGTQHQQVDDALKYYKYAVGINPRKAWYNYDYACELIRWSRTDEEHEQGIERLQLAVKLLPACAKKVETESYLSGCLDDERVKRIIEGAGE